MKILPNASIPKFPRTLVGDKRKLHRSPLLPFLILALTSHLGLGGDTQQRDFDLTLTQEFEAILPTYKGHPDIYDSLVKKYFGPGRHQNERARALDVLVSHPEARAHFQFIFDRIRKIEAGEIERNGQAFLSLLKDDSKKSDLVLLGLRGFPKGIEREAFNSAMGIVQRGSESKRLAHTLSYYGERLKGEPLNQSERAALFKKGGTNINEEIIRQVAASDPGAASDLLKVFDRKGTFTNTLESKDRLPRFMDPEYLIMSLIKDGTLKLNSDNKKYLKSLLLDPSVSPNVKSSIYSSLSVVDPKMANDTLNLLLGSPRAWDHLTANAMVKENDPRIKQILARDVATEQDPSTLSLLAQSLPADASVGMGLQKTNLKPTLERLINHPDPAVRNLALTEMENHGTSFGLFGSLVDNLLEKEKTAQANSPNADFSNVESLEKFRTALNAMPHEVRTNSRRLVAGLTIPELSPRKRSLLLEVLARAKTPEALSSFVDVLEEPIDPKRWQKDRFDYLHSAQGVGSILTENPDIDPKTKQRIADLLKTKNAGFDGARTYLRKFLPSNLLRKMEPQIIQAQRDPSNVDPCQVACRIATHFSEKAVGKWKVEPDSYYHSSEGPNAFALAVNSLVAEFLVKANGQGCSVPRLKDHLDTLLTQATEGRKKKDAEEVSPGSEHENSDLLRNIKDAGADTDTLSRVSAFLSSTGKFAQQNSSHLPRNGAAVFSVIHLGRLLNTLDGIGLVDNTALMSELKSQVSDHLTKMIQQRNNITTEERDDGGDTTNNSRFTTYHLSAALLGFPEPSLNSAGKKLGVSLLTDERDKNLKRFGDPNRFGYYLGSQWEAKVKINASQSKVRDSDTNALLRGARSSAARSVVASLALYNGEGAELKLANADRLLRALGSYDQHFNEIFSGIGEQRTHDIYESDQLAPYYGPSTIPYAFEAISKLKEEINLTTEQKQKLGGIASSMQAKLLNMFEPKGLFRPQDKEFYAASEIYDNALTGLALVTACKMHEENNRDPKSLRGIQSTATGSKSLPPTHNQVETKPSHR
jgi:hypothetical protein